MDTSSISNNIKPTTKSEKDCSITINDEKQSKKEDQSRNFLKSVSPSKTSASPFAEMKDLNSKKKNKSKEKEKNVKVFEDSSLFKKTIQQKKKKLKFKQPFIEYINIESYKSLNSLMCFSDPHMEIKIKKCKCFIL